MKTSITPLFLAYKANNSDKWYVTVEIPSVPLGLTGYGPNKPNANGTWGEVSCDEARKKVSEKRRKGYTGVSPGDIPKPAITQLLTRIGKALGGEATIAQDGTITIATAAPAKPAKGPKRRSSRNQVWI